MPSHRFGNTIILVNPWFRHRHHRFIFTSSCFADPFFCRGFFPSTSFYPPLFWPGAGYFEQSYPAVQQAQPAQIYEDSELRSRIDRLAEEVERLREAQESRNEAQRPETGGQSSVVQSPTILVFRDGHRSEVQNYGIVGQTLWVFTERQARKIPLSDIDVSATKAANAERGVEFTVPTR